MSLFYRDFVILVTSEEAANAHFGSFDFGYVLIVRPTQCESILTRPIRKIHENVAFASLADIAPPRATPSHKTEKSLKIASQIPPHTNQSSLPFVFQVLQYRCVTALSRESKPMKGVLLWVIAAHPHFSVISLAFRPSP